jgi:hypothetical protein
MKKLIHLSTLEMRVLMASYCLRAKKYPHQNDAGEADQAAFASSVLYKYDKTSSIVQAPQVAFTRPSILSLLGIFRRTEGTRT